MAISFIAGKPEPAKAFTVPPGTYKLKIIEAKEDTSTNGNDMIILTFRITKEDGSEGPRFRENVMFMPSCQWKVDAFYKACDRHPGEGNPFNTNTAAMIGWECEARLKLTKDGKYNEIDAFLWDEF